MPEEEKDLSRVQKDMEIRDNNDSKRKSAPLKPAEDAVEIDSTFLTIEQVVEKMLGYIEKAGQA
jgi:cytidylate kinase